MSIIYKEFFKAANENLDGLVPSWWGFRWDAPIQVVAVLATLAAIPHGEGATITAGANYCGPGDYDSTWPKQYLLAKNAILLIPILVIDNNPGYR